MALVTQRENGDDGARLKVHYYEFNERWDEWLPETPETLARIKPYGSTGRAEEPPNKALNLIVMHRLARSTAEALQIVGTPYPLTIGNWMTWDEVYCEIANQVQKHCSKPAVKDDEDVMEDPSMDNSLNRNMIGLDRSRKSVLGRKTMHGQYQNYSTGTSAKLLLEPLPQKTVEIRRNKSKLETVPEQL